MKYKDNIFSLHNCKYTSNLSCAYILNSDIVNRDVSSVVWETAHKRLNNSKKWMQITVIVTE